MKQIIKNVYDINKRYLHYSSNVTYFLSRPKVNQNKVP